jgi:anti-sigma B factor antagonist
MQLLYTEKRKPMPTIHEAEQQIADRQCRTAPKRSHDSLATEQTDVPQWTADTVSLGLLAACEQHQDVAVLNVHGEIDLETAPALRETLLPVLEQQTGPVVVDLSEVSFMDSTGVHVLVNTLRRLEPQNRPLAIVCRECGQVHRLLALVGLLDTLSVYRSHENAVIGGDDRLRSEPRRNRRPSDARAPTESLLSARQTTEC